MLVFTCVETLRWLWSVWSPAGSGALSALTHWQGQSLVREGAVVGCVARHLSYLTEWMDLLSLLPATRLFTISIAFLTEHERFCLLEKNFECWQWTGKIFHRLTSFYNHIAKETNTGLQPYLNAFEYILLNSHTNPQEFITFPYKIIKLFKIDSFPYTASK